MFSKMTLTAAALAAFATAASAEVVSITASDQIVSDNIVKADRVYAATGGWLVLHDVDPAGTGFDSVGEVLGKTWINEGENLDVAVASMKDIEPDERVVLMVYGDEGPMAQEFEMDADKPYTVDGNVVMLVVTNK